MIVFTNVKNITSLWLHYVVHKVVHPLPFLSYKLHNGAVSAEFYADFDVTDAGGEEILSEDNRFIDDATASWKTANFPSVPSGMSEQNEIVGYDLTLFSIQ